MNKHTKKSEKLQDLDTEKAIDFLESIAIFEYINLVSIDVKNSNIEGLTSFIYDGKAKRFIDKYNGKRNLYFTVNEPKPDAPNSKLRKEHVSKIRGIWVDLDPDKKKDFQKERARLVNIINKMQTSVNPPTYIVDSGGGFQAFWLLKQSVPATPDNIREYEARSRALEDKYGGDKCHNIDRIMRIPFTLNIPCKKKVKVGRKPAISSVYWKNCEGGRYE